MEALFTPLLYLHILCGTVALIVGPLTLMVQKGGKRHRLMGKIFSLSMIFNGVAALLIAITPGHENFFLFAVGVFSLYLVGTGYRFLSLKGLGKSTQAQPIDWALSIAMLIFGLSMWGYGGFLIYHGVSLGYVLLTFGTFGLILVYRDSQLFLRGPKNDRFWLYQHISRMCGALIAAYTAFLVVNGENLGLPPLVAWLFPSVIGSLIPSYWIRKYKRKYQQAKKLS
ncbi:MAG: DUF2306 domain-containing protein [Bacteroidota bacterium]